MANVESPQLFRLPRPQVGMLVTKCVWVCEILDTTVLSLLGVLLIISLLLLCVQSECLSEHSTYHC